jgi:hypothetical protein
MTDVGKAAEGRAASKSFLLHGLTARALIYGIILSVFLALADPYIYMVCGGLLAANSTPVGAVFMFAVVVFVFNMLMRGLDNLCGGRSVFGVLKLNAAELVVVYIMMLVTLAIPTFGFSESFFAIISGPAHFANDTNAWSEKVLPHINPNLVPFGAPDGSETSAERLRKMIGTTKSIRESEPAHIRYLYEGLPNIDKLGFFERVRVIPWGPWIRPFLVWMIMIFTVYFVCLCLVSILRKQWMERERLQYPLVQLPMAMVEEADAARGVPALFRNKLLWIGFFIPMLLVSWNQLAHFYQLVTPIATSTMLFFFNRTMSIDLGFNWPVIGFTYLIKLEVALSLWFFCIVGALVGTGFTNLGVKAGSQDLWLWRGHEHPWAYHACFGAVMFLGLFTLWSARRAIAEVVRKAFFRGRDIDDSNELLPHGVAFWGLIIGVGVMVSWMWYFTGMNPGWAVLAVVVALLGLLAATRMIAEGGLVFVQFPMMVESFLFRMIGPTTLGPANLMGLSWMGVWVGDIRVLMMPAFANAAKLADHVRLKQRRLVWLFVIAIVLAIVASSFSVLYVGYTRGGSWTSSWIFGPVGRDWFDVISAQNIPTAEQIRQGQHAGEEYHMSRVYATLIGAGFMVFLAVMRSSFLWWPFHPLGFPFAIMPAMQKMWSSVAIAWFLKAVILRYGGAALFRKLKPFFFGLILGQFVTAGLWYTFYFFYVTYFHGAGDLIYN